MKKQQKQFIGVVVVLLIFVAAYFLLSNYNKKQSDLEASEEEAAKIYVTDVDQDAVTAFSYQLDSATVTMTKDDSDNWTYQEAPAEDMDESQVNTMVGYLNKLEAAQLVEDPEDLSEYGFDEPTNVITMTTGNGTVTLTIGMQNSITNQYYLTTSENDNLYLVESSLVTEFQKSPEDMIAEAESTETETPAEASDSESEALSTTEE